MLGGGRVEETRDGGRTWRPCEKGLGAPWPRTMVERFVQVDDELLAILSDGSVYETPLESLEWRRIFPELDGVMAVAAFQGGEAQWRT